MPPKVLICSTIVWAHNEVKQLLGNIADIVYVDSPNRAAFLAEFKPGGKYAGTVGIYRENESAKKLGVFDKELIDGLPSSVRWIAHNGAGYDPVDVHACIAKGIYLSNTPGAVDDATATTALYLLISTLRQYSAAERSLRALKWKPAGLNRISHDVTGRTLGILGLGGIGLRLAELVQSFPMRVVYHSRRRNANAPSYCEYFENVEEMLAQTDVLSIHVPLREDTVGLVGEKWIRALKPGSIIINTARGKVIDEEALIRALEDGHLQAAGLDVYPNEPEVNPRLLEFPQVTLLPHMGTENQDSQKKMEVRALTNLRDFLTTGAGKDLVIEYKQKGLIPATKVNSKL
ncbi:2-hydroxyacid dehydrogenase [Coprinopsis cinerea okayama7|uniref:2-hydroxyacid dehydrogenase n=1 Tax=Coprinopsis cinerea (strain Okayama-7 / 130 / ATCC MYA-4618 / FGSC 9003) TaxID=240176 RepID=D6RLD1_COPC7|nr:2-hydroxyacid dehydrogenase [Coprinopsis cinerea okayama7\|eukprot:XP_002911652.1 2-hydroxyacid dehydrogenase [Coprinopsis cinerea okayama7\